MKLGTLMVGGILGAAAVIYFNKGKKSMFSAAAGNSINKAMSKAKNTFGAKNQSWGVSKFDSKQDGNSNNLGDVKKIVEEDDKLHSQVQEILAEEGKSSSAYATQ
jgi:hypothetical protein